MMSNTHHDPDLEILSALFDSELQGDAARFAMKRLGHDEQWRQAFGHWQLMGDALRGQAGTVAPSGFAARVAAAVSVEPTPVAVALATAVSAGPAVAVPATAASATTLSVAAGSRRKWIGGAALAASVAMVAMFVARPFSQDSSPTPGSARPAPTELATAPISAPVPAPAAITPSLPDTTLQVGAAVVAVAEVPRRASERRSRGQSQRAALRAPKRSAAAQAIASTTNATAVAANEPAQNSPVNPFHPQPAEAVSRPWPRAVLPASPATGAFTASYGTASSPSFYPFEPRLPNAADVAPASLNANGPRP